MTQLYRIKPLEWRRDFDGSLVAGAYKVSASGPFHWGRDGSEDWTGGVEETEDEAKAACEAHRRDLMEAELEPAYQPTTDLPTEPGLYWWKQYGAAPWRDLRVYEWPNDDSEMVLHTEGVTLMLWSELHGPGQWIRIPEPEDKP